jgi:hypothetical protein
MSQVPDWIYARSRPRSARTYTYGHSSPVLASVLSFTTCSLSGHTLEPAVIFTSLTLFQMLRMPLMFLRAS